MRNSSRLFNRLSHFRQGVRNVSTAQSASVRPLLLGTLAVGGAVGSYIAYTTIKDKKIISIPMATVSAAAVPGSQASVYSPTKEHALYLTIHVKNSAEAKAVARAVANLPKYIDAVCPPDLRDESDEILAGVGFGPSFYAKIGGKAKKDYSYADRKGALGNMPATGGDIFIHAKSDNVSKLFELTQAIIAAVPAGSIERFEDIYSFVYRNGRDLSGFIDGTENAADEDDRRNIAVEKETGGSYVITQKWIHNLDLIAKEKDSNMEGWVGRTRPDSVELKKKPISSHVARMTGGNQFAQKKKFEIVRQSMPYGTVSDKAGLFFIGYAASPENFNYMLDRMVGKGEDKHCDDVMRLTTCVSGNYFYFPGESEMAKLR